MNNQITALQNNGISGTTAAGGSNQLTYDEWIKAGSDCDGLQSIAEGVNLAEQMKELLAEIKAALEEEDDIRDKEAEASQLQAEAVAADPNAQQADKDAAQEKANQDKKAAEAGATLGEITTTTPPFFDEQCFLLSFAPQLSAYKADVLDGQMNSKRLPYYNTQTATSKGAWNNSAPYNASLLAAGDPFGFVNHLTQYPGYEKILNMKTSEIANLQPMIRLFKIITPYDSEGNPQPDSEFAFEIPFDSYFTKKDMDWYKSKDKRGVGVGIKDFTFSYEADNPFAVKKSIKAKLTIFANSFDELLVPRGDKEEFKYVDLALKTGRARSFSLASLNPKESNVVQQNLAKLDFRLKAVVGWAPPSAQYSALSGPVKTAIYNSYVSLNLTPTVHTFDIDDQGRVNFVINYLAYVEDFFDQPNFNIFTDMEVEKNRINRKIKFQTWTAKCDSENFSELKKAEQETIESDKIKSFQSLIGSLFGSSTDPSTQKIKYLELSPGEILDFRKQGPFAEIKQKLEQGGQVSSLGGDAALDLSGQIQAAIGASGENDSNASQRQKMLSIAGTGAENKTQTLTFFYVSDLVDIILAGLDDKYGESSNSIPKYLETLAQNPGKYLKSPKDVPMTDSETKAQIEQQTKIAQAMGAQFKRFRLLLGPVELVNQANLNESNFNSLGDLPISVKYFTEWVSRKMAKRDEVYYPLPKFLNDFFNELLREFLNSSSCFNNQAKQKTRLSQAVITSYKNSPQEPDEITSLIVDERTKDPTKNLARLNLADNNGVRPLLANNSGDQDSPIVEKPVSYEVNYLVFFAGQTQPAERMKGNEAEDHSRGIFHYGIGRDRGITKTIKLKKTDSTGLKELRFEQDGYDGLKQLREVFDVDIDTYANVNAYPGNYIFVDPKGFSPQSTLGNEVVDLTQIGIGGYHMIIRSEHSFGPGRANSRIFAKWVASTDARATTTQQGGSMTSAAPSNAVYCWSETSNREEEAKKGSG